MDGHDEVHVARGFAPGGGGLRPKPPATLHQMTHHPPSSLQLKVVNAAVDPKTQTGPSLQLWTLDPRPQPKT